MTDTLALVRLLQLASPALPVGAYTYSQGMEWAVEAGIVHDEESAGAWIGGVMAAGVCGFELPLLGRVMKAWQAGDSPAVAGLNERFLASRETAELRAETVQMGYSLARLVPEFAPAGAPALPEGIDEPAFPTVWALLAAGWGLPAEHALSAYVWAWLENQVLAAVKAVPLGQSAGQRLLARLAGDIPAHVQRALVVDPDDWSNFAPMLALASSLHESQYSRLFRS